MFNIHHSVYLSVIYLLIINLFIINLKALENDFCLNEDTLHNVFIIKSHIYFGFDAKHFWKFSLKTKEIVAYQSFDQILGTNPFDSVLSAVVFDFNPCYSYRGDDYCSNAGKAKDLVIVLGYINAQMSYASYRLSKDNDLLNAIVDNSEMPWDMTATGTISGNSFWQRFPVINNNVSIAGLAFESTNNIETLYMSCFRNNRSSGDIFIKQINLKGILDKNWTFAVGDKYFGLFFVYRSVFALTVNNRFHQLQWSGIYLSKMDEFNAKELFNCFKNSTFTFYKESLPSPPSNATQPANTNSNFLFWPYLLVSLIVLAIIGALIFIVWREMKKRKTKEEVMSARSDKKQKLENKIQSKEEAIVISKDKASAEHEDNEKLDSIRSNITSH